MGSRSEFYLNGVWVSGGTPVGNRPAQPTLTLSALSTQITATVTPGSDGGSPITGYLWTCNPGALTASTSAGQPSTPFTGLATGTTFTVTVTAVNAIGSSPPASGTVQTQNPPPPPGTYVKPTSASTFCRIARSSLTPITGAAIDQATKGSNPQRTWSGYLVTGGFQVNCDDFSMTDCIIESSASRTDYYLLRGFYFARGHVSHCLFDGLGSTAAAPGVAVELGTDWVIDNTEMRGCQDALHPAPHSTVISCWGHQPVVSPGAHADAAQCFGGGAWDSLVMHGTRLDASDALGGANSCIQFGNWNAGATIANWDVTDNWLDGGFTCLSGQFTLEPDRVTLVPMTNMNIKRNQFGLGMNAVLRNGTIANVWSDPSNVWELDGTNAGGTVVKAGAPIVTQPAPQPMTRTGTTLQVAGTPMRLSGMNAYWLGLDESNGNSTIGSYPTHAQITAAFQGMREMGFNTCRSHTVGISTGHTNSFESAAGVFNGAALDSADWAVYIAGVYGIKLMVPLTDNWNYYHGGKWNFVHWAFLQNPTGITDVNGVINDDPNERIFFANTTAGLRVRALYKAYISAWLNHVNPYTGLAYKADPTIAIVETGNELYYASQIGSDEWTQDIASYIKSIAPAKLVADGSACNWIATSTAPGITAAAVDIIGSHYYPTTSGGVDAPFATSFPRSGSVGYPAGSATAQLTADINAATAAGKAFIVGEYPWTRSDVAAWWTQIEGASTVAGDFPWYFAATKADGTPENGSAVFGSSSFPIHRPYANANELTYGPALASHISRITGIPKTNGA